MSGSEILIIMVVALLLFGGKRLPELLRTWGKLLRELRRNYRQFRRQIGLDDIDDILNGKK
ncbi:twin-arginine translocase TatA/TatE family subunit [bacterium]|nr:twin-arginine translocase TatA/TatE family subunit [bacterium]